MAKWNGSYSWDTPPSASGAPPRLRVATCQLPLGHDIGANAALLAELTRQAAASGAEVAHFPECALSGYGPATWPDWSGFDWKALEDGVERLQETARACRIWVVTGSVHRRSPEARPSNALLVLDRQGAVAGRYDKRCCSMNDRRAFVPGLEPLTLEIEGVRCGFLICLDWAFPELWQAYAGQAELVFHSCASDGSRHEKNQAHTIPALMQGYAWLHHFAISVANACRPGQDFPSFWVERSGHRGRQAQRGRSGFVVNALADDPEQDRFFEMVHRFRESVREEASARRGLPRPIAESED